MSKQIIGSCALCKKEKKLNFEHIPPRAALNMAPAKPVLIESLLLSSNLPWETKGIQYRNLQKGMGLYSICEDCNSKTGGYYGTDYVDFACAIDWFLAKKDYALFQGIEIQKIHPLRFIKQVASMFCSINEVANSELDDLREFVLNKNAIGLDKSKYKICMYFTHSVFYKYIPLSAITKKSNVTIQVSEIATYPLGFIMYLYPIPNYTYEGIDITSFVDDDYDYECKLQMPLCIKEVNSALPLDFRTKKELNMVTIKDMKNNGIVIDMACINSFLSLSLSA